MSPPPVRVETNASLLPSGENSGRDSAAGCDTTRCASPPAAGTVQMSPPETKAISERSGERAGSKKETLGSAAKSVKGSNVAVRNKTVRMMRGDIPVLKHNRRFSPRLCVSAVRKPSGLSLNQVHRDALWTRGFFNAETQRRGENLLDLEQAQISFCTFFHVNAVDEPDLSGVVRHHEAVRAHAVAEESHAAQQVAFGDARRREENFLAGREIARGVSGVGVLDAHRLDAIAQGFIFHDQPSENFAVQAAHRRGRQHAFGSAARSHDGMHTGARDRRRNAGGQIAVTDQADARACLANVAD